MTEVFESNPNFFGDNSIIEQSACVIGDKRGARTAGISLIIHGTNQNEGIEILLGYEELEAALAYLKADQESLPHLYQPSTVDLN